MGFLPPSLSVSCSFAFHSIDPSLIGRLIASYKLHSSTKLQEPGKRTCH